MVLNLSVGEMPNRTKTEWATKRNRTAKRFSHASHMSRETIGSRSVPGHVDDESRSPAVEHRR